MFTFTVALAWASLALGAWQLVAGLATRRWPRVAGVVVEAHAEPGTRDAVLWRPVVRYRYEVGGVAHEGRRVFRVGRGATPSSRRDAERVVAGLRPGDPVVVWHHPRRPAVSVLRAGPEWWSTLLLLGFGLVYGVAMPLAELASQAAATGAR